MNPRASSGVWEAFVPGLGQGAVYKYHLRSSYHMYEVDKADPTVITTRSHRARHRSCGNWIISGTTRGADAP